MHFFKIRKKIPIPNSDDVAPSPEALKDRIIDAIRTVRDPEIPINIYELGLIYGIDLHPGGVVSIRMTLTSHACPVAGSLPLEVKSKVRALPGVASVSVEIVWDPPWNRNMISEAGKLQLGMF